MDPHRLAELRSIELHRHVAVAMSARPEIVPMARERVARLLREGVLDARIAARWVALLDEPPDVLAERLVADVEAMRDLRQSTPFTFVVSPRERWRIWREVRGRAERHEAA